MQKKLVFIIVSLILLISAISIVAIFVFKNTEEETLPEQKESNGKITFIYGTRVFSSSSNDGKYSDVNISVTSNLILELAKPIKKFAVSDIHLTASDLFGIVKNIKPKHVLRSDNCINWYLGPCDKIPNPSEVESEGDRFEFNVVPEESAKYLDEITKEGTSNTIFNVIVSKISQIEPEKIKKEKGGFENSKVLQYANLTEKRLNSTLTYQMEIEFEDGEKFIKQFQYVVNSVDLLAKGYTTENKEEKL